ncbi:ATP-grasp domain-containing protein [Patescibacteria group bacterium]|nr:ATP-grasp domain-containing protein [Patescibacteria group bacterium]
MLNKFLSSEKKLYINDRHEEADTDKEDRRKLYDKRILPLLKENDYAVFGDPIDNFLWDYYKNLGLARINSENIFYAPDYLNYPSLTKAVLNNDSLINKIKQKKISQLVPYIESYDSQFLAQKINSRVIREASFLDWINNKSNYRQVIKNIGFPCISGLTVSSLDDTKRAFRFLKEQGFKEIILKRERSVAGFGDFILNTEKELEERVKKSFSDSKSLLLEGFIPDVEFTSNVQYWVEAKKIIPVLISDQILAKDRVSYQGSIFPSRLNRSLRLLEKIRSLSLDFCNYLQKQKCYGFVGIDYIITKEKKIYSTEANVRFNASTFNALIADCLFKSSDDIFWKSFSINNCFLSFEDMFNSFSDILITEKGQSGIFPIGVDLLQLLGEGQFMVVGKNFKEINILEKKFKKKIQNEK